MRTLHQLPLSPQCREVRLALAEKRLDIVLTGEEGWSDGAAFLKLNPAGTVPVLVEADGNAVAERSAILEYLEEAYPTPSLLPGSPRARAEIRRLVCWFDGKFNAEVSAPLLFERLDKRVLRMGSPDMGVVRTALEHLNTHLAYIGELADQRKWLGGDTFSLADIAAGAHLSCIDYLGDVPWPQHPRAKDWYARIKSRPAFRPLLSDHISGVQPPRSYTDLDF